MPLDECEATSFLGNDQRSHKRAWKSASRSPWCGLAPLLGLLLVLSNGIWLLYYEVLRLDQCLRPKLIYSPATTSISYERTTLWRSIEQDNVFTGDPRDELDEAWRNLVKPMTIKITAQELQQLGESSIAMKDGSGYIAELAVFHELHCIKRIRRHLRLDYYYGNMTEDEETREARHMDHCLEYWREAAMCRGDPTLATFVWHEGKPFSKVHSVHECVNWDRLQGWAESRMVDASDLSIFSH
ncbi:hypothetical protein PG993_000293 [Apiospora rasikravindrae]|uniref:Uncharacterized protein n=1 Tax=Apiospora rasikravindrae TaxID=990691 RepID=A0ABR1U844_9PEZI